MEPEAFTLPCYPDSGFHPIQGTHRTNLALGGLVYEGLYEVDPSFEAQPVLAVSSTVSEDGLTWTFTLRQGVTFSDGTALTAQDVVTSLNLARESALYSARLSAITSVTAGEGTVVIRLSTPCLLYTSYLFATDPLLLSRRALCSQFPLFYWYRMCYTIHLKN